MGDKMKPLWTGKYIFVDSLGKGRLMLQNADTGKKLANTYHASDVRLRPKYAEGPEETIYEEKEKSSPKCQKPPQRKPVKRCRRNSSEEESQFTLSQSTDACLYLDSSGDHYDGILNVQ